MLYPEVMQDQELENVAGGNLFETAKDSFELFDRGLMNEHYNVFETAEEWDKISAEVDAAWKKAGIMVITKPFGGNVYELNGKKICHGEALDYLQANFKLRKV